MAQIYIGMFTLSFGFLLTCLPYTNGNSANTLESDLLKMGDFSASTPRRSLATTSTSSKSGFDKCRCDLTSNSCDAYGCGDSDGSTDLQIKWSKTDNTGLYEGPKVDALSAPDCYDRSVVGNLADLQYGLRIYSNNVRSILGVLWTREGDSQQTFLDQDFGITTSTQFNSEIENAEDDFSTPLEATSTVIPTLYDLGTDIYLNTNEVFKMPLPNSFGLCEEVRNIKFGENINATRCTRYITYNTCDTDLNAEDYTGLTFSSKTGSTVAVTIGNTWVVTESDRAIDSSTLSAFATTTQSKSGTTCTCSKVLKEIHYTAIISSTYDEITSITADVVYYDLTAANCTNTLKFEQIYSFSFKGSEYARSQSGSSGYEYGYPVLIGDINTDDFIEAYETGFQLYGIDTSGEGIIDSSTTIDPNTNYYSNPTINFADNVLYGCSLSFTVSELSTFGNDATKIKNIALFRNLVDNLKYIGMYGNSNPYYTSDWIEIEYASTSETPASFSDRTCTFDSGYDLVFYLTNQAKKGSQRYKISKATLTPSHERVWKHNLADSTASQTFHALLSISFQVTQEETYEYALSVPNKLPKMDRNVLYPFFVFDD